MMNKTDDKAWIRYQERFSSLYESSNYSNFAQSYCMNASHRLLEEPFGKDRYFEKVLEVGAGTGTHLEFVRHRYGEYYLTDHNHDMLNLAKENYSQFKNTALKFEVQNGEKLEYPDNTFDRLIAVHVLEHIYRPQDTLKEWSRVLKDGGTLSILIPTDPGIGWRLGRHLGPRRAIMAQGIEYDYVMALEHVNSCNNLIAILRHYFPNPIEHWWPLKVPMIDINLFFSFNVQVQK